MASFFCVLWSLVEADRSALPAARPRVHTHYCEASPALQAAPADAGAAPGAVAAATAAHDGNDDEDPVNGASVGAPGVVGGQR